MNVSVQREVVPGTSVTFSFVRRDYKNLIWSDNMLDQPVGLHDVQRSRSRTTVETVTSTA